MPEQDIEQLKKRIQELEIIIFSFVRSDKFIFSKNIDIITDVGISIGKSTGQKLSVYGVTPVVQGAAVAAPSGGATVDAEARTAINTIRTRLTNFGITA